MDRTSIGPVSYEGGLRCEIDVDRIQIKCGQAFILSCPVLFYCRESFNQGRRRYYIDLRQNSRGRFLKLTMLAGGERVWPMSSHMTLSLRYLLARFLFYMYCSSGNFRQ